MTAMHADHAMQARVIAEIQVASRRITAAMMVTALAAKHFMKNVAITISLKTTTKLLPYLTDTGNAVAVAALQEMCALQ